MVDWLSAAFKWLPVAVGLSPMILGIGWGFVEGMILPRLIPREEIERLADDLMHTSPWDPEGAVFSEEHAAWRRVEIYEQGKWHRVRTVIRKRFRSGRMSPAPPTPLPWTSDAASPTPRRLIP